MTQSSDLQQPLSRCLALGFLLIELILMAMFTGFVSSAFGILQENADVVLLERLEDVTR